MAGKKKSAPKKKTTPKKEVVKKKAVKKTSTPKSGIHAKLAFSNTNFLGTMGLKEGTDYIDMGYDNYNRKILLFNNLTTEQHDLLIGECGGTVPIAICL